MGIIKKGVAAIGKLLILVALAGAFLVGAVSAVYLSLRGEEVKVPEVVGKDFYASEDQIAALGLKIKKRATRYSEEKPNTILEQLPKPGETVKTGQTILVVISEVNPEGTEAPAKIDKSTADDDAAEDSTDVAPDKPVKTNKNSNTKKPTQKTRDVITNKSDSNTASNTSSGNSSSVTNANKSDAGNKSGSAAPPANKTTAPVNSNKTEPAKAATPKPTPAKAPVTGGDTRTRKVQ
jgi:hypothetical protein